MSVATDICECPHIYYSAPKRNEFGLQVWYTGSTWHIPLNTVDYVDSRKYIKKQRDNIVRNVLSWQHIASGMSFNSRVGYMHQWNAYDYAVERSAGIMNNSITSRTTTNMFYGDFDWGWTPGQRLYLTAAANGKYDLVMTADHAALAGVRGYNKGRLDLGIALSARWQTTQRLGLSVVIREDIAGSEADVPPSALFADYIIYRPANLTF